EMQDLNSEDISQRLTQDLNKPGTQINLIGDPVSAMETAPIKVDATYEVPFLTHAPMEPMTCTAKVTPESCEVWVPTQGVQFLQSALGTLTGLDSSSIEVHPTYLGGAFGRKIETDYVVHAVLAAKAVGKPVKVIWSREEDIQHGFYRPAFKAELKGGIDDTNSITSWIGKNVGPSMVSGFGLNYDPSAITGFSDIPYEAPNFSAHYVESNFGIPVGWWRSVGHSQNSFFVESFTDELAHAAGEDPLVFRRAHLKDNARILTVLERVAEMANWGQASVPGATHGVALVLYSNALLAQIAEVSVESGGEVKVHKVYCAIDCGDVVNPDIVKAQIEGSVIFGLTATLYGEITIEKGRVKQSNFHDHPLLTIKDSPVVETEIIISGATLGGVGETGLPTIAPAVTNAIYAATGHRIRKLPVSRYEFS
ncbi:MAG: molybdopterin cofactor-binding domain-containing protein, partial [Thermodesulfobacteriota bacterium]